MDGRTRSSNASAWFSVLVGLVSAAAVPVAILLAQWRHVVGTLHAWPAIPLAAATGVLALVLARAGRRRFDWTLGRAGGAGAARLGRILGGLGIYLAVTALLAIAVFELLNRFSD